MVISELYQDRHSITSAQTHGERMLAQCFLVFVLLLFVFFTHLFPGDVDKDLSLESGILTEKLLYARYCRPG